MQYAADGFLPEALLNYLVRLGWSHGDQELFSKEQMIALFELSACNRSGSAFDNEKLQWVNQHYMQEADPESLGQLLAQYLTKEGVEVNAGPNPVQIAQMQKERCKTMQEMAKISTYFYQDFDDYDAKAAKKQLRPVAIGPLSAARDAFANIQQWNAQTVQAAIEQTLESLDIGYGKIGLPLRVAVTGVGASPSLDQTLEALGQQRTLDRIDRALAFMTAREQSN
jgi:glutamyl-tRNA synthetase